MSRHYDEKTPKDPDEHVIFVYGTLLTNHGNWSWALSPTIGVPDTVTGFALHTLTAFPMAIRTDDPNDILHGELFVVDGTELRAIDRLEGYSPSSDRNTFYIREEITTDSGVTAMLYSSTQATRYPKIESGDWRER